MTALLTSKLFEDTKQYENQVICEDFQIKDLLERIDRYKIKVFFVIDADYLFKGVISEGDIRRYLIKHNVLPAQISEVINIDCVFCFEADLKHPAKQNKISHWMQVPVLSAEYKLLGFLPKRTLLGSILETSHVSVIAPTRISFAGGGSDLNYWFSKHTGCVINLGIAKYARVNVKANFTETINITSMNTKEKLTINVWDLTAYQGVKLNLIIQCLKACSVRDGLNIEIACDFKPGTGIGGSSSLVVALLTALNKLYGKKLLTRELIELAYNVERNQSGILGGWQDQIIAVNGGLCVTNFKNDTFSCFKLDLSNDAIGCLNSQLFLSPIGKFRDSSTIHKTQEKQKNNSSYVSKMKKIVQLAEECSDEIGQQNLDSLGEILHKSWLLKRSLGDFISNKEIDKRYELLRSFGVSGGKLLGAGASGYLLVMVPIEKQVNFLSCTAQLDIPIERVSIDEGGVRVV